MRVLYAEVRPWREPSGTPGESMADPRVSAAVLFCPPGTGGADLSPMAAQYFPSTGEAIWISRIGPVNHWRRNCVGVVGRRSAL
ncbi:hypothetical protein [Nocardia africana]|uniref:Uncharacterized protein n=1 Tax=Nocardia africana TaxID=134964 RepID=A0ABW6NJ16_9NOCA